MTCLYLTDPNATDAHKDGFSQLLIVGNGLFSTFQKKKKSRGTTPCASRSCGTDVGLVEVSWTSQSVDFELLP